jgi:hypothetical protein
MEAQMLTNWISPDALKSLNDGFVVVIMLEAKEGDADALAEILRGERVPFIPFLAN